MKSGIYTGLNTFVNPPAYNGPVVYEGVDAYVNEVANFQLLYIDQVIVSMICIDGTDGKANAFQLVAVCDDGLNHNSHVTWSSSAPGVASVSSTGVVSGVSAGTAVISASHNGVTVFCTVTIFATFPNVTTLQTLPGGKYAGAYFTNSNPLINGLGQLVGSKHLALYNTSINGTRFVLYNNSKSIYHQMFGNQFYRYNRVNSAGNYTDTGYRNAAVSGSGVLVDFKTVGPQSPMMKINGINVNGFLDGPYMGPTDPALVLYSFESGLGVKSLTLAFALQTASEADLDNYTQCPLFYVPQNFVKYENDGVRNNYTEILNFGTAGTIFNLSADNVPAGWF